MIKIIRSQISPLLFRMHSFTSAKLIESAKALLYRTKPYQLCSLIQQNRSFAGTLPALITVIEYDRLNKFIEQNEGLIIDVRTKEEIIATGVLPNSHNIPVDEINTAFKLTPNEFLNKYNFTKPDKELSIVVSCAKGIRSSNACKHLVELGYKNIFNYAEGWYGWESRNK